MLSVVADIQSNLDSSARKLFEERSAEQAAKTELIEALQHLGFTLVPSHGQESSSWKKDAQHISITHGCVFWTGRGSAVPVLSVAEALDFARSRLKRGAP